MFVSPEKRVDIAIILITKVAWDELKNLAIRGAEKNRMQKRTVPRMAETVQAVSRYDSTLSSFWIKAVWKPVSENLSRVAIESMAMPRMPKSSGASKRARIMVLMNPNPPFMIRNAKTHRPPLTTLLERSSGVIFGFCMSMNEAKGFILAGFSLS